MSSLLEKVEAFKIALEAIKVNKVRGILTTLGIIIGIVAVVTTMTAANGLANNFKESISAVGSDVLYVSRVPWIFNGRFFQFRNRPNLSLKDSDKLKSRLRTAVAVNPSTNTRRDIKYRSNIIEGTTIIGTTDKHIVAADGLPEIGRFLTSFDVQYRKKVCIIGTEIRERVFKNIDTINKSLKIGWHKFTVVGVMERQGSAGFFGGPNYDSQIFEPISTFEKYFGEVLKQYGYEVKIGTIMQG